MTDSQVEAIVSAALEVSHEGQAVFPEIALPMLCSDHELEALLPIIRKAAQAVPSYLLHALSYLIM